MTKSYTERLLEKTRQIEKKAVLDLRPVVHLEQKKQQLSLKQSFDLIQHCTAPESRRLHIKQYAIAVDQSLRIALCAGRRFGKSEVLVARAVDAAISHVNSNIWYCGKTLTWCQETPWKTLQAMLNRSGIEVHLNYSSLKATFPNGSTIHFVGADDSGDINKMRGKGKDMVLAIVDEMQDIRDEIAIPFIEEVLDYCLLDRRGTLIVAGTVSETNAGWWYKTFTTPDNGWAKHEGTAYDNPFFTKEAIDEFIDDKCKRMGVDRNDPTIQREFFNNWDTQSDWLVYKYNAVLNADDLPIVIEKPKDKPVRILYLKDIDARAPFWRFAVGIDSGNADRDVIVVLGQNQKKPEIHLVREWVSMRGANLGYTPMIEELKLIRKVYRASHYFADTDTASKKTSAELAKNHGFTVIEAAKKQDRKGQIRTLNDALRTGRIKAPGDSKVVEDFLLTMWDKNASIPFSLFASSWHPDASEAFRYGFQGIYEHWYKEPDKRSPKQREIETAEAMREAPFADPDDPVWDEQGFTDVENVGIFSNPMGTRKA